MEERLYATQMEAARKGIVTKELEIVAKKEKMEVKELLPLVASGKVVIPANKNHKCLDPEGIGSMLKTKINVNLGISKDCKDYDVEMEKVMSAVKMGGEAIMDLSSHGNTQPFRKKLTSECPAMIGTVPVYDSVIHYQRDLDTLTAKDFIDVVRLHAQDGVDFVTLHCGITRKTIEQIKKHKRKMNIVSRGGSLVFAAFSGSHQDAIAKGMHWIEEKDPDHWTVPYLPIDPRDVGRSYDANVIRINSQSGKGGVGYILETKYGLNLPPKMREAMGYAAKAVSDHTHKELHPDEIFELFKETFENVKKPLDIQKVHFQQNGHITTQVTSSFEGRVITTEADGNGRLDAVSNALKKAYDMQYTLVSYTEHALEMSTSSKAIAYVGIQKPDGSLSWGAGVDSDIIRASIDALVTAINNR